MVSTGILVYGDYQMLFSKDKIMAHLYKKEGYEYKKSIKGFWKDSVFELYEVFVTLHKEENIKGNLCEIGTWYGRSFLPLRNFTEDYETCVGVDMFHKQAYYDGLINNIKNCFGNLDGCEIIKSESIKLGTRLEKYAPYRIFYIDGDHSYQGALLDLNIAKSTLHEKGIILLDDYDNPRYGPDVVKAVNIFLEENQEFLLAFSSTQRIFLCKKSVIDLYVSKVSNLGWNKGKDKIWPKLTSFEHPLGYNCWQSSKQLTQFEN